MATSSTSVPSDLGLDQGQQEPAVSRAVDFSPSWCLGIQGYNHSHEGTMRLQNFEISSSIELQSGGLFWDIHNFAKFDGLELIQSENAAIMRWSVSRSLGSCSRVGNGTLPVPRGSVAGGADVLMANETPATAGSSAIFLGKQRNMPKRLAQ